jgi:hypothetical protein
MKEILSKELSKDFEKLTLGDFDVTQKIPVKGRDGKTYDFPVEMEMQTKKIFDFIDNNVTVDAKGNPLSPEQKQAMKDSFCNIPIIDEEGKRTTTNGYLNLNIDNPLLAAKNPRGPKVRKKLTVKIANLKGKCFASIKNLKIFPRNSMLATKFKTNTPKLIILQLKVTFFTELKIRKLNRVV